MSGEPVRRLCLGVCAFRAGPLQHDINMLYYRGLAILRQLAAVAVCVRVGV